MIRRFSLTARLTGFYLLVATGLLLGMAWTVSAAISRHFIELDHETLQDKVQLVQGVVLKAGSHKDLRTRLDDALQNHPGLYVRIDHADGQLLYGTSDFAFPVELLQRVTLTGGSSTVSWSEGQVQFRGVSAALSPSVALPQPGRILVALDTGHHAHFERDLHHALWGYVLVGAALSGLLAWWAARAGLAPLRLLKSKAQQVTAHKLDQRMDVQSIPVEFADLAASLNEMLQRLQADFQRLSDFSSDLAHELRTPINNLLTQTEVVLSRARDQDTYRDTLASNAEELQRLSRMVSDMLLLAKAEHGLLPLPSSAEIDLSAEVQALFDFYEALADERGVVLARQGQAVVQGDRLMLRRAISNLLSNALRYAPRGSTVTVSLEQTAQAASIRVANVGDAIPAEMLPRLFDRFFRADRARVHLDSDGTGLGLSITQAIARAHGGSVHAASGHGVNEFCVHLPFGHP